MEPREVILNMLPKATQGAEIGVHEGNFSLHILKIARPTVLHLIDPWKHQEESAYQGARYGGLMTTGQEGMDVRFQRVQDRFDRLVKAGRVVLHRKFSDQAAAEFEDGSLGWVYIDGNHTYECVLRDLELYFEKLSPEGILAGDDYGDVGWWKNGVTRAVQTFAQAHPNVNVVVMANQFLIHKS
jgi:hypothetical protein